VAKNINVKEDEEELVGAVIGLCDTLRTVEEIDKGAAARLRDEAMKLLSDCKQRAWDSLPGKFKREIVERSKKTPAHTETTHRPPAKADHSQ
jgi:hypothetical protein